jgi:PPOX class probable F420-dependent enzyme
VPEPKFSPKHIEFLNSLQVAHLATVDGLGAPNVVPVCFAVHHDAIYIAIDEKPKRKQPSSLKRVSNIAGNPHVCLVADRYDDQWQRLAWVQVHGEATLVEDRLERSEALRVLRQRYAQYRSMDLESRPLVRIRPSRVNIWSIDGSL